MAFGVAGRLEVLYDVLGAFVWEQDKDLHPDVFVGETACWWLERYQVSQLRNEPSDHLKFLLADRDVLEIVLDLLRIRLRFVGFNKRGDALLDYCLFV